MRTIITRLLMSITLLCFSITASAFEGEVFVINGIAYEVLSENDGTCQVYNGTETEGDVVIPSKVNYEGRQFLVTRIGDFAFTGNKSIKSVTIPESVTEIGEKAFELCEMLTAVTIPNSVTNIGNSAFYNCSSLMSVEIPESVTKIGYRTFAFCSSLRSVTIPDSVTEIEPSAFIFCTALSSVTIPDSITEIGSVAFAQCKELTNVYYNCIDPIEIEDDTIFPNFLGKASLYVPEAAVEKCMITAPWKYFKNIEAYDFSGVETVNGDPAKSVKSRYDMSGSPVDEDYKGMVIVKYSDGSIQKIFQK